MDIKEILRSALILALIGAVSGGSIGAAVRVTAPIIESRASERLNQSLRSIMPQGNSFEELTLDDGTIYYRVYDNTELLGYVLRTVRMGYNPGIAVLTGFNLDGDILAVQVVAHEETATIGGRRVIDNVGFMNQFIGRTAGENLVFGRDIDSVSQATITARGVHNAVNDALQLFDVIHFGFR